MLAAALDPIITHDAYGVVLSASNSVWRVFGWRPRELVGRNVSVLVPEPHRSRHDSYLARFRRTGRSTILGRTREFLAQRKDGTLIPIEIRVSKTEPRLRAGPIFVAIIRDVTAQRRHEAALREHETRLGLALDAARLGVFTHDLASDTIFPDARARAIMGDRAARIPMRTFFRRLRPEDGVRLRASIARALRSRAPDSRERLEFRVHRPGDGEIWVSSRVSVERDAAGQPVRINGLIEDISARRRTEDELEHYRHHLEDLVAERTEELRKSHEQVRVADRMASIGTLAAGLGHDMNNVLLPVRAHLNAALAAAPAEDPRVRESVRQIQRCVDYLQQLADGLHFLAADPEHEDAGGGTDLATWWEHTGALLSKPVPRHVRVEASIPRTLPRAAIAPHRLTQAVLNLIVNAGQAIPPGGVTNGRAGLIRVSARRARSTNSRRVSDPSRGTNAQLPGAMVRLSVRDNGTGMTDDVKRRAFDMFFTTKSRGLGTGLGLPLVARVVKNAGGTVHIASTLGKGTTVSLDLPVMA